MAGGREGGSSVGGVGGGSGGLDTIPAEKETNQAWLLLLNSLSFLIMDYCKKSVCKDTQSRFASVNFECVLGLGSPHQAQHIRQCSCFSEDPEVMHEARVSALEGPCDSSKSHSKENNIFPSERSLICSPSK